MSAPTMHPEAFRLVITLDYNDPMRSTIKRLGAKWDGQDRAWWVGTQHPNHDTIKTLLVEYGASTDASTAGGQYDNDYHRPSRRMAA